MGLPRFGSVSWEGRRTDLNFNQQQRRTFPSKTQRQLWSFYQKAESLMQSVQSSGLSKMPSLARLVSIADK